MWEPPQGQRQPMRGRQEIDRASTWVLKFWWFLILCDPTCSLICEMLMWDDMICMWHYLIELTQIITTTLKTNLINILQKNQINLKPTLTKSTKTGKSQWSSHLQLGQAEKANSDIIFYYFNGYSFFGRKENSLNNQTNGYSLTCWKWWLDIREMLS